MDVTPVVPINLFRLTLLTENDDKTLQFCKTIGMFPREIKCPNCGVILEKIYKIKNRNTTHFRYQCNKHQCRGKKIRNTVTLKGHTWFNEAKLNIRKSLFMTYCFVYQLSYKDTIRETTINSRWFRSLPKNIYWNCVWLQTLLLWHLLQHSIRRNQWPNWWLKFNSWNRRI